MLLYNLPGVVPTTLVGYAGVVLAVVGPLHDVDVLLPEGREELIKLT